MDRAQQQEIARNWRSYNRRLIAQILLATNIVPAITMATIFNPYDVTLDLTTNEGRTLFKDACKGVKDSDLYDGSKEKYNNFEKLLEKPIP